MAKLTVTVADADLPAVDAVWIKNGLAGGLTERLQQFADAETKGAKQAALAAAVVAAKTPDEIKAALYAEHLAKVS
jgi:hypothetical protein